MHKSRRHAHAARCRWRAAEARAEAEREDGIPDRERYIDPRRSILILSLFAQLAKEGIEIRRKREPLTEEQIERAVRRLYGDDTAARMGLAMDIETCRAIEAAHGIKGSE